MKPAAWLPRLRMPDEVRLAWFRAAHPDVTISSLWSGSAWQARWEDDNWETVITKYTLAALLDALDGIFRPG